MFSQATFPAYFTRSDELLLAQTQLDATVFGSRVAPGVGITVRYVGEEPACPVTAYYNQVLGAVLPQHGVELKVVKRVTLAGDFISASKVRELIRTDDWSAIARVVPASTYDYLLSEAAKPVIAKIKQVQSRH